MVAWFRENFEDPAQNTPHNSQEGGYQYIWGGPYDARDQLSDFSPQIISEFGDEAEVRLIDRAVDGVESEGLSDWAPNLGRVDRDHDNDGFVLGTAEGAMIVTEKGEMIAASPGKQVVYEAPRPKFVGVDAKAAVTEIVEWFGTKFAPATADNSDQYRGWPVYASELSTMEALSSLNDALTTEFGPINGMMIAGDAADKIERQMNGVDRWVRTTILTPPIADRPAKAPNTEKQARERAATALDALSAAMDELPRPSPSIGHNNPPEPINFGPFSWMDWHELETAVASAKSQTESPSPEPVDIHRSAETIEAKARKIRDWAAEGFVKGFSQAAGVTFYGLMIAAASALALWAGFLP
ncbi:hypothetical protein LCGC14_0597600 [marine sediment metagenome]